MKGVKLVVPAIILIGIDLSIELIHLFKIFLLVLNVRIFTDNLGKFFNINSFNLFIYIFCYWCKKIIWKDL